MRSSQSLFVYYSESIEKKFRLKDKKIHIKNMTDGLKTEEIVVFCSKLIQKWEKSDSIDEDEFEKLEDLIFAQGDHELISQFNKLFPIVDDEMSMCNKTTKFNLKFKLSRGSRVSTDNIPGVGGNLRSFLKYLGSCIPMFNTADLELSFEKNETSPERKSDENVATTPAEELPEAEKLI